MALARAAQTLARPVAAASRVVAQHQNQFLGGYSRRWMSASGPAIGDYMTMEVRDDGVAVVTLDNKKEPVNTLSEGMNKEFEAVLDELENNSAIKAAVVISGKPGTFIAGADIKMLAAAKSADELEALSRHGHAMFDRLEKGRVPVVAAIDGSCLGGGLEVALACNYRIASSNPKTALALPEVMLGLLPGGGGTQRLPRLIGLQQALPLALTGKNVRPDKAKRMGLVDSVADPNALLHAAVLAAKGLADGSVKATKKKKSFLNRVLEDTPLKAIIFKKAKEQVEKNAGPHYPAPYAILRCIEASTGNKDEGFKTEAREFGKLGMTSVSKSLQGIFFGQTKCKKNPYGKPKTNVTNVAVLGAGLMGAGIANVSAAKGYRVVMKDKDLKGLTRGEKQIADSFEPKVKRRSMTAFERDVILSRIIGLTDQDASWPRHLKKADVVIEAVFEDMAVKHALIKELEPMMADHAVFATNTSALPITEIATAAKKPERVIGMHYFSPVDKMPLLEIIPHAGTSNEIAAMATEVGLKQGKTVIVVKDVPGFYVNRCLGPFMTEFAALLQEGVPIETLDKTMKGFGFPVGPVTLADEVGIDVANHVGVFLGDKLDNRMGGANPEAMQAMVDGGMLGRKSGRGFYVYGQGKKGSRTLNQDAVALVNKYVTSEAGKTMEKSDMQMRMVLRFMNEAFFCLQDGIISSPVDGDIGAVFGMGFPPFLGGPFKYCDQLGAQQVVDMMNRYASEVGPHFAPCQLLVDNAKAGKTWH